jgi:hypothetical protein
MPLSTCVSCCRLWLRHPTLIILVVVVGLLYTYIMQFSTWVATGHKDADTPWYVLVLTVTVVAVSRTFLGVSLGMWCSLWLRRPIHFILIADFFIHTVASGHKDATTTRYMPGLHSKWCRRVCGFNTVACGCGMWLRHPTHFFILISDLLHTHIIFFSTFYCG